MNRVRLYVSGVALGAVAAAICVYWVAPVVDAGSIRAALWMSGLSVFALLLVYQLPAGAGGSIGFIPFTATALLSPNWIAVVAVAVTNIITEIISVRDGVKKVFNVVQMSLATSLAVLSYLLLGGKPLLQYSGMSAPQALATVGVPFSVMVIVFVAVNTVAVSGAIATNDSKNLLKVWRQNHLGSLAYDVLASPVAFLLAWCYARFGAFGALVLALPLLGVRQLYKTNRQLERVNQELLELMVKAIEARDPYTSGHSRRVSHYAKLIARALGLSSREIERIATAALLHDVGKIHEIYAPILRKPDKLTADEWAVMQTHPIKSAELVSTVSQLRDLVLPVRHHHENWDGSGYPDGLAGEQIPLGSRVVLIADTIDAMTTDRPYRKALGEVQVRSELAKYRGRQFDPKICDELLASPMFGLLFASPAQRDAAPASRPKDISIAQLA